jgi:hypothetical protein
MEIRHSRAILEGTSTKFWAVLSQHGGHGPDDESTSPPAETTYATPVMSGILSGQELNISVDTINHHEETVDRNSKTTEGDEIQL